MSRLLPLSILVFILAACTPAVAQPSAPPSVQPSQPVGSPSVPPSDAPSEPPASPSPAPTERPSPSTPGPIATPEPTEAPAPEFTADERMLEHGIMRDAIDCRPIRDDLPGKAVAGIECRSNDPAVARIGYFLFESDADMLAAYFARMDAEGVVRDSGGSADEEGESAYIPGPEGEVVADRDGVFVNAEGYANYRATLSGSHVYIGILGRTADMGSLIDFAWRGVQDVPGMPSLWGQPID